MKAIVFLLMSVVFFGARPNQAWAQNTKNSDHHTEEKSNEKTENDGSQSKKTTTVEKNICGALEVFEGDVQILNPTKTHLIELRHKAPVPCGSWISSNEGWVHLKHSAGPTVNLGPGTYAQLLPSSHSKEQVILFQGQVYLDVNSGDGEFKVGSAMGRARIDRGKVIYLTGYSEKTSAQLVVLADVATFENRFEETKKVRVSEGEMSELSFDLLRVMPKEPTPISVAALKPKFFDLRVDEKVQAKAISLATHRKERVALVHNDGANQESDDDVETPKKGKAQNRSLASSESKSPKSESAIMHDQALLEKKLEEKLAPGVSEPETLIYPGRKPKLTLKERAERKKLLEQIKQFQAEP